MTAPRPFAPTSLGSVKTCIIEAREETLKKSGQYVYHMPIGGTRQPVVMHYQYIPVEAGIGTDFNPSGTVPKLWGVVLHFCDVPKEYHEGNSAKGPSGSQFEVDGWIYNAKKVTINHMCLIYIELVLDDKCKAPRPEFCDEIDEILSC